MTLKRIAPAEAHALITGEGYVYIDVRSVAEFEAGHPAGAYNVPLAHAGGVPNPSFAAVIERRFGKAGAIVVGCQAGGRSLRAATLLAEAGFTNVVDQQGGWGGQRDAFGRVTTPGWERAGLPTAAAREPGHSWAELERS